MSTDNSGNASSLVSHLVELRDRVLRVVVCALLLFVALSFYANEIYSYVAEPLLRFLPNNNSMIAIDVISPFLTPFRLAMVVAIFLSMPVTLYQFWAFIAPGLYRHERLMALPLLASSITLFYLGITFAYFIVFPLVFEFISLTTPDGIEVMTDISKYLDFVLTIFFAFGLSFQVPIVTIVLVWTGITTPKGLAEKRPYIIVMAFVVGMLLTPPDIISQTMLAAPIWILFELGLLFSRPFARKNTKDATTVDN